MKKLLLFTFALFLWTGAWAQDVNYCAGDGVSATLIKDNPAENVSVPNVLNNSGAQPNYYNAADEMNIVIDLLESKTIEGFAITFSGDRWVSEFTLSYSTDGESYTKIGDYSTGRVAQHPETNFSHSFNSSIEARYIKYTSKKSNKNNKTDQWSETIKNFALLQYGTIPAAPEIVSDSHKLGIYSCVLGNATDYGWQPWGSSTGRETVFFQGKIATQFSNFTYYGSQFAKIDATAYTTLHLDIYSTYTGTLAIFPITGSPEKGIQINVVENSWNSKDLSIDDFTDLGLNMENVYQIKYVDHVNASHEPVNGDGTHTFIIGNVYLYGTPIIDTENPTMTNVTVASTNHKSATLTVNATDNNTTGTLTYKVKNSSNEVVATGSATQGENATVVISGLTASTDYEAGVFKVTATDHAGNESTSMNVPAFSTAAAPTGQSYTNGTHEILVQPRHYTGTFDYELIITSEEAMTGFTDGCYWKLNGSQNGTQMKKADIVITDEGKTMTVRVRSSVAPVMDTPLYILMPGEVSFKEANESNPQFDWVGIASGKTYDVLVNDDKAAVIGTISSSNLSEFRTSVGNASVVNISGATIANDINELTTNNANVLFEYANNTEAAAATKTSNNVYYVNVRFYGAPNGLTFVDDPSNVPLLPEKAYTAMNNGKLVINRSISANNYITSFMSNNAGSMEAVLEDGLEAYELTAAQAGQLTFTKVDGNISKGKGYVIHNTSSGTLNMKWQSFGAEIYLDNEIHNQAEGDVTEVDGVKILGTMHTITTDGSQWILSGNEIKKGNGAMISPYRAYFTGVTPASGKASAVFVDGETTKIGSINANGEINVENGAVYNLAGQRVAHPTKGLYIVNGKKVLIK